MLEVSSSSPPTVHWLLSQHSCPLSSKPSAFVSNFLHFSPLCNLTMTIYIANARAQLMTVPPYVVCAVVLCTCCYISDRIQSRGMLIVCTTITCGIGYALLLAVADNNHVRYFATFLITSGTYTTIGLIIVWCKCYPFCRIPLSFIGIGRRSQFGI